jgi:hypothetical protein
MAMQGACSNGGATSWRCMQLRSAEQAAGGRLWEVELASAAALGRAPLRGHRCGSALASTGDMSRGGAQAAGCSARFCRGSVTLLGMLRTPRTASHRAGTPKTIKIIRVIPLILETKTPNCTGNRPGVALA